MDLHGPAQDDELAFLRGGCEAGAMIRAHDWAASPLGSPADWPAPLRSAVTLCINALHPVAIYWGPDLRLLFGDAFMPFLDRRRDEALGRPAREVWSNIWDELEPQFEQVWSGRGFATEELRLDLPIDGLPAERYWSYSLSPILDTSGCVLGVLNMAAELTDKVISRRLQRAIIDLGDRFAELRDADEVVRVGCETIGHSLGAVRSGRGVVDQDEQSITVTGSWADGVDGADGDYLLDDYWGDFAAELRAGHAVVVNDVDTDPRTAATRDAYRAQQIGAFINVPVLDAGRVRLITFVHSDRPRRWTALEVQFVRDVVSRGRAAADRARAEAALRESETRHRHAVELSPLRMWTAGPNGELDHVAPELSERVTRTGLGARWIEAVHPDDRACSMAAWMSCVETGRPYDVEFRVLLQDGSVRAMRSRANPQRDGAGRITKWYGSLEDIEDAKQAAAALAASEARLRAITDSVDQMIWTTAPDGYHDYFNQTWYEYTGAPPGSTDGEDWILLFHPDDRSRTSAQWQRSLQTGEPYRIEYRLKHRSGQFRWVLGRANPMRDADGRIERWYGTCTDIQDIVEAREVLARSREELERLVVQTGADRERIWRLSTELMVVVRPNGAITAANPAWRRVLGWEDRELIGRLFVDLVHPDDLATTRAGLSRLSSEGTDERFESRMRGADGSYRWLSWTAVPEAGLIHAVARDMTTERASALELEAAQEVLRQSQKMEAVGQLTGGIAHDFNNMLAVVIGSLDLLGRRLDATDERARRYVSNAMEGARRAATLTQRLLAFARQQTLSPVSLDVNALVGGMGELLRGSLGAPVRLEVTGQPGLWRTLADQNQLENAVLNLAVNARDAMPDGGSLRIAAANAAVGHDRPDVPPGEYVVLSIADSGIGMPPEVIAKVFDPFFTTKDVGKGTGLGLSQVYGFVKQSGGHVTIASSPGGGTTITIYLPRDERAPSDPAPASVPRTRSPMATGGTVLVVEDEPAVRRFSAEAVRELGFRALEAEGAAPALALLDTHPDVELLFTDIVMPDMNGRALADEARRRRPGLKVLFATGYAGAEEDKLDTPGGQLPSSHLIGKPYTVEQLAAKLRDVLDDSAGSPTVRGPAAGDEVLRGMKAGAPV